MSTDTDADIVQSWPPHPASVPAARARLHECLREWDLVGMGDASALVLTELTTNAVRHARTDFTVTLSRMTSGLLIRVDDDDDAVQPASPTSPGDELSLGGRGMHLVEAMTADWGVVPDGRGGKAVWALLVNV